MVVRLYLFILPFGTDLGSIFISKAYAFCVKESPDSAWATEGLKEHSDKSYRQSALQTQNGAEAWPIGTKAVNSSLNHGGYMWQG